MGGPAHAPDLLNLSIEGGMNNASTAVRREGHTAHQQPACPPGGGRGSAAHGGIPTGGPRSGATAGALQEHERTSACDECAFTSHTLDPWPPPPTLGEQAVGAAAAWASTPRTVNAGAAPAGRVHADSPPPHLPQPLKPLAWASAARLVHTCGGRRRRLLHAWPDTPQPCPPLDHKPEHARSPGNQGTLFGIPDASCGASGHVACR